jgi:hypothetical protein
MKSIARHFHFLVVLIAAIFGLAPCTATAAPATPAFSVSKRGTYTAASQISGFLAGSLVTSDSSTGDRFVIGQNSVNIESGGAVLTLTADKKLTLKIKPSYAAGITVSGTGTWKWSSATTLSLSGTAVVTTAQGPVNATWNSTVKFPSAGKAVFKLTANGTFSGFPVKVVIDANAQK